MSGSLHRRRRADAGESLAELLVTMVILGTSVLAVMAAVGTAVGASTLDQRQVQAQSVLRTWGESVAAVSDSAYGTCLSATQVKAATPAPSPLPAGFTPDVTSVKYWDASSSSFVTGCAGDPGLRLVRLQLVADTMLYPGFTETLDVVVRKPCVSC
jgi:type II secretory pathway pseudopilin PulG